MLLKDNEKWLDSVYADSGINFVSNPSPKRGEKIKISAQKSYLDWDLNNALNNTFYK